ncbi:MAG: heliorhodopsin HeR [Candidatus Izimaplasma sp.]|nr:heliorhodopsin HeR [Candidatus Izimaplasma bacterium]
MEKTSLKSLRKFNIIMGAFHLVQGILMIILGLVLSDLGDFKMQLYQHYLTFVETGPGQGYLAFARTEAFTLPFFVLVAMFLLISAIAHALISLPEKFNTIYNKDLEKGINRFRWFEYALSSSIMIVLIAYLFGVWDIASLILIFLVNASMNLFGLVMEQLNSGKEKEDVNWGPFIWGSIAGLAPWIAIILYMTGASPEATAETPWFVWAIVITYFIAFNSFPVNMIFQYLKKGKWKNYLYGERGYIILSLVAKSVLAWLVLVGALQP